MIDKILETITGVIILLALLSLTVCLAMHALR